MASSLKGPREQLFRGVYCSHCNFSIAKYSQIYTLRQRATREEINAGIQKKTKVYHQSCVDSNSALKASLMKEDDSIPTESYFEIEDKVKDHQEPASISMNDHITSQEMMDAEMPHAVTPVQPILRGSNDLLTMIAEGIMPLVEARLKGTLDTNEVKVIAKECIVDSLAGIEERMVKIAKEYTSNQVKTIEVVNKEKGTKINVGVAHKQFPDLLTVVSAKQPHNGGRLNIWLTGPAGTGKTKASEMVAEALDLSFSTDGALTDTLGVFGYKSPVTGEYQSTVCRKAVEFGGVHVFDDFDSSDPNAATQMLTLLGSQNITFPDKTVKRHEDCVLILTANTFGLGGTNDYCGRVRQDAAFLDRFAFMSWEIDEDLERVTVGNDKWVSRVQEVRARVREKGLKVLITPRASYFGAALLQEGMGQDKVEALTLKKGMSEDQWYSVSR